MMSIPTDPFSAALWGINLALEAYDIKADIDKLADGIAARAEKEGRDVTPDELALIKKIRDEALEA